MPYQVHATVNYPEAKEIETPSQRCQILWSVEQWVHELLTSEPDATSFVITVVKG